jgi:hypothetical protein
LVAVTEPVQARGQLFAQPPQWELSVNRSVSHPSDACPLQSPLFALQPATVHWLFAHPAVPLGTVHACEHVPQLAGSTLTCASHPSPGCVLQSAQPALQLATVQLPETHAAVALGTLQVFPHPPQLPGSAVVGVSHPFETIPSQSAQPLSHTPTAQAPAAHPDDAWGTAGHIRPQLPQLFGSAARLTSQPSATSALQLA